MTVFIHAYRSFSMRYLASSDILTKLKDSGEQIVLFVQDDEVEHFEKLFPENQIAIEPVLYLSLIHI